MSGTVLGASRARVRARVRHGVMHPPLPIAMAFAVAVQKLIEVIGAETARLASKRNLDPQDIRALNELASALAALNRGPLWEARRVLAAQTQ